MANDDNSHASPVAIEKHLKGVDYPASNEDLIQHAQDQNAPEDVLSVLKRMPEQKYNSPIDVTKAAGQLE